MSISNEENCGMQSSPIWIGGEGGGRGWNLTSDNGAHTNRIKWRGPVAMTAIEMSQLCLLGLWEMSHKKKKMAITTMEIKSDSSAFGTTAKLQWNSQTLN